MFVFLLRSVRSERLASHQLEKSPHQEPFAYPRRPWEVELVAEGWSEDEVVDVCQETAP